MTVGELIKELKQYPPDMKVTRVENFENVDEFGNSESTDVEGVIKQRYPDTQFDMSDEDVELMIY